MKRLLGSVAVVLFVGTTALGFFPTPAGASDSLTGTQRPSPDQQGHSAYCNVGMPGSSTVGAGGNMTVAVKCQYSPTTSVAWTAGTGFYFNATQRIHFNDGHEEVTNNATVVSFFATATINTAGKFSTSKTYQPLGGGGSGAQACTSGGGCWLRYEAPFNGMIVLTSGAATGGSCTSCSRLESGTAFAAGTDNAMSLNVDQGDNPKMPYDYFAGGSIGDPPPLYCDITGLTGDLSETVAKDPAQDYRYEVSFAGRDGHTAAPDKITFSAAWQENNQDAKVPDTDVTVEAPAIKSGTTYALYVATPPAVSPVIFHVHFAQPKLYVLNFGCVSDDGHETNVTGGDYLPDPDEGQLAQDFATQKLQECVPSGWGLLNPMAYARVTGCVFEYLLVPIQPISTRWDELQAAAGDSVVGTVTDVASDIYAVPGDFAEAATADTGCAGLPIDMSVLTPQAGTIYPFSACANASKKAADLSQLILSLGLVLGGAVTAVNMMMSVWGGPKINNVSLDDASGPDSGRQGRFIL
jgi:hypothetical protein